MTTANQNMKNKIYTRNEIENLKVGDLVLNCFGEEKPITTITHKGVDINGKYFACFYQEFSGNSTMSNSIKEGETQWCIK